MEVLCVGLSKTGTTSLHHALILLGYKSLHYDETRLNSVLSGKEKEPNFQIYDDYDAVSDLPSAYFFRELAEAYPDSKIILTVRDVDSWYESLRKHFAERHPVVKPNIVIRVLSLVGHQFSQKKIQDFEFRTNLRNLCYGSIYPREYAYKTRYLQHNEAVKREIPEERLLVLNPVDGDKWEKLCPFLGKEVPPQDFPKSNRADKQKTRLQRIVQKVTGV